MYATVLLILDSFENLLSANTINISVEAATITKVTRFDDTSTVSIQVKSVEIG